MTIEAQLQDYLLGETLYEGPETRIRRATQLGSGRRLVAKVPVAAVPSLHILGRLAHEAQILARLSGVPGVVRLHALHQQGGSAALLLQDPGFASLDRVLAESGAMGVESALQVGLGLCRVLEGVHAAGVMHKDIKPHKGRRGSPATDIIPLPGALRRGAAPKYDPGRKHAVSGITAAKSADLAHAGCANLA